VPSAARLPVGRLQLFNVYLPPALIRRVKHAAIDEPTSLSRKSARSQAHPARLVETALTAYLDRLEEERSR